MNLAVLDKHEMVYVERVRVPGYRDFNIDIGSRIPAWSTAVGGAVLAYQELNRLKEIVGALKGVPEFISNGGEKRLARHLEAVRRDGFAINDRDLSKK